MPQTSAFNKEDENPDKVTHYFILKNGDESGPFTRSQLNSMWNLGQITCDVLYRVSNSANWSPITMLCENESSQKMEYYLHHELECSNACFNYYSKITAIAKIFAVKFLFGLKILFGFSRKLLIILIALSIIGVAKIFAPPVVHYLFEKTKNFLVVKRYPESSWNRHNLIGLSIEAPFPISTKLDMMRELSDAKVFAVADFDILRSESKENPSVTIVRIKYKPDAQYALDEVMKDTMNTQIRSLSASGYRDQRFSHIVTTVDGHAARRVRYAGSLGETLIQMDSVFVQKGRTIWQAHVYSAGYTPSSVARRILDSIRIDSEFEDELDVILFPSENIGREDDGQIRAQQQAEKKSVAISAAKQAAENMGQEITQIYKNRLLRAINTRWFMLKRQESEQSDKFQNQVVRLRFFVRNDGILLAPETIEGSEHKELLEMSRNAIRGINGQLDPFPDIMRQQLGEGYYQEITLPPQQGRHPIAQ